MMDNTEGLAQAMNDSFMRDQNKELKRRVDLLETAVAILCRRFNGQATLQQEHEFVSNYGNNQAKL